MRRFKDLTESGFSTLLPCSQMRCVLTGVMIFPPLGDTVLHIAEKDASAERIALTS